jgi:lysyl-tRNA synthetase class 2
MNLMSAITPPITSRLDLLRDLLPMGAEQAASALVAVSGIALLLLSRGVRRGQRHAWALAVIVTAMSAALHVMKGLDIEEASVALIVLGYLLLNRRAFCASADRPSLTRALSTLAFGGVAALFVGTVTALWIPDQSHMSVSRAFVAIAERLVGLHDIAITGRRDRFLSPTLGAVGLALAVFAGWLVFRPVVRRRLTSTGEWAHAREIVERHGGDTLSYFALRDDKQHWFWRDTVVAYAVHNGVCLVSPDPIGPVRERRGAWQAFRQYADEHGWPVAVMGAGESWRPIYRETGMRDLYIGDEAVVDVRTFCLAGGRMKGLRQAVNRIEKYGYRVEFRDPSRLEPELELQLRALMTESRRGEVERGFSMTLGRVFCPDDRGLLMAVCFGPDGQAAAFCQYVPAADIGGYSLDLMRRSESGDHWNGVTDFVVVRTIEHLRDEGHRGLGLNFAVMRSVLAEEGDGLGRRLERRMLGWLSDSMQIESLWRYNAKFDPGWRPRYAVYDAAENFLTSAVAVAKAESFWDLPVVGRFFTPDEDLVASKQ